MAKNYCQSCTSTGRDVAGQSAQLMDKIYQDVGCCSEVPRCRRVVYGRMVLVLVL